MAQARSHSRPALRSVRRTPDSSTAWQRAAEVVPLGTTGSAAFRSTVCVLHVFAYLVLSCCSIASTSAAAGWPKAVAHFNSTASEG